MANKKIENKPANEVSCLPPTLRQKAYVLMDVILESCYNASLSKTNMKDIHEIRYAMTSPFSPFEMMELCKVIDKILNLSGKFHASPLGMEKLDEKSSWNVLLQRATKIKKQLSEELAIESNDPNLRIELFLTVDGLLYREPKEQLNYNLSDSSLKLKILQALTYTYKSTETLRREVNTASRGAVRKAVGEINSNTKIKLRLHNRLIESKPDSGYRIDAQYHITRLSL
ncbi:MAG: hypothetical protein WCT40_04345 [Candidatus Magasanikbacteria bacterium]|jgi:hypothetical protein